MCIVDLSLPLYFTRYIIYFSKDKCCVVCIIYCAVVIKLLLHAGDLDRRLKCYLRTINIILPCHERLKIEPVGKPAYIIVVKQTLSAQCRYIIGSPCCYNAVPEALAPLSETLHDDHQIICILKIVLCYACQLLYSAFKLRIISRLYKFRKEIFTYLSVGNRHSAYLYYLYLQHLSARYPRFFLAYRLTPFHIKHNVCHPCASLPYII